VKPFRFLNPAEAEMVAAAKYYESQSPGLGQRFLREVRRIISAIADYPLAGSKMRGNIRRRLVRNFPFAILYSATKEEVLVIAVMDLRRDPDYWLDRM
jgi:plasmid stabilization system protein ParE